MRSHSADLEVTEPSEGSPLLSQRRGRTSSVWHRLRNRLLPQTESVQYVPPHKRYFKRQMMYESLDYEITESTVEMRERRKLTSKAHFRDVILRWVILFFIGVE